MFDSGKDLLSYESGRAEAIRDLATGRRRLISGAPSKSAWGLDLVETMHWHFSVEIQFTSDLTDTFKLSYEAGYNDEVMAHIERMFGAGEYARRFAEVQERRKARYDADFAAKNSQP